MTDVLIPLVVIAVLILLNGLFVAAEFAVVAARNTRIAQLVKEGQRGAVRVQEIIRNARNQDRFIAIAQLGITLATIGLGMYGEPAIAGWIYGPVGRTFGVSETLAHTIGTVIAVGVMTYFHVVVGEMIPKALALGAPERTSLVVSGPMRVVGTLFYPLVLLLNTVANGLLRLLRIPVQSEGRFYTPAELEQLVQESSEQGLLPSEQREIIGSIFDFGERDVYQLMTPRVQVQGLPLESSAEEVWTLLERSHHSRFPVFEGDLDHIVGVLHVKDFLKQQRSGVPFDLQALLRHAPRVPETARAETLLDTFKRQRVHLAVGVDEYGGTAGIITLDDLLEEVVGKMSQTPEEGPDIAPQADGSLLVSGEVLLEDLAAHLDTPVASETSDTVAGLVLEHLGRVAQSGDTVTAQHLTLTVERVDNLAITLVRVVPVEPLPETAETAPLTDA